jgi:transposase InsO family protein
VHMDLCDLPHDYFGTVTDEATRFCTVFRVQRKSDTEAAVRQILAWSETQTGQRVQKVRHDRGGGYMGGSRRQFYGERDVQMEPASAYAPEANGIAERHNLRLLDMARPMLAGSGDARHGLEPLGERFAGDAIMYANDLHNAMPASGAQVGRTHSEGFLGPAVALDVLRRFGCRV